MEKSDGFLNRSKMRQSKEFEEYDQVVSLRVNTKCPEKWLLIDRQTGDVYQGNVGGYWDRLDPVTRD
jgi:hypothetical protein